MGNFFECQRTLSEDAFTALRMVSIFASVLSVMGSSFVIVNFLLRSRGQLFSRLIASLALGDLGSSISIILSDSWLQASPATYSFDVCVVFRSLFEFFTTATFFWTSIIALYLCLEVVFEKPFGGPWKGVAFFWASSAFGWGLPLLMDIFLLAAHLYQTLEGAGWCHPKQPWILVLWEMPLFGCFLINIILYLFITMWLHRKKHGEEIKGMAGRVIADAVAIKYQRRMSVFLLVYLLCWGPDVIAHIVNYVDPRCWFWLLSITTTFLVPLQGFLNSIIYFFINKDLRANFGGKYYLLWLFISFVTAPLFVIPAAIYAAVIQFPYCGYLLGRALEWVYGPQQRAPLFLATSFEETEGFNRTDRYEIS